MELRAKEMNMADYGPTWWAWWQIQPVPKNSQVCFLTRLSDMRNQNHGFTLEISVLGVNPFLFWVTQQNFSNVSLN